MNPSQFNRIRLRNACAAAQECGGVVLMSPHDAEVYMKSMDEEDQAFFILKLYEEEAIIQIRP